MRHNRADGPFGYETSTFDTVKLTFSEALDATTATNAANYTISPSLAVTAAAYKNKVVTLTTAKQTPGSTPTRWR